MATNVGCIAVLLGTMGIVTGAAADESNASLTKNVVCPQCCSLKQNSVRPDLVKRLYARDQWFDRLTTSG